jgi:endonuclease YncB( thermonuclease family)
MPAGKNASGRKRRLKALRNVVLALVAVSLFQLATDGSVSWHRVVLDQLEESTGINAAGPDSAWQRLLGWLQELGERREGRPLPDFDLSGRVVRVADGDTLSLLDDANDQHRIRLFGIDTPEWDQPHGDAARNALSRLVEGELVGVVVVDTDSLGRTVGTVYHGDTNINLALVEGGHAWWYEYFAPHERALERAQQEASQQRRGLWAGPDPEPPWDWRRRQRADRQARP